MEKLAAVAAAQTSYTDTGLTCGVFTHILVKSSCRQPLQRLQQDRRFCKACPGNTVSKSGIRFLSYKIKVSWNQISGAERIFCLSEKTLPVIEKDRHPYRRKDSSRILIPTQLRNLLHLHGKKPHRTIDGKKVSGAYHAAGALPNRGSGRRRSCFQSWRHCTVSWKQVSGANGYLIYRKKMPPVIGKKSALSPAANLSYTDKRRDPGVSYSYTASKAYRKVGQKVYSGYSSRCQPT